MPETDFKRSRRTFKRPRLVPKDTSPSPTIFRPDVKLDPSRITDLRGTTLKDQPPLPPYSDGAFDPTLPPGNRKRRQGKRKRIRTNTARLANTARLD